MNSNIFLERLIFGMIFFLVFLPATSIADSLFQMPLDNYIKGENVYGSFNMISNQKWHLGEDAKAVAATSVKAIAYGIVKHAQNHPMYYDADGDLVKNYGGMYIIEHTLLSGEKICSLYAHMDFNTFTKKVGQTVQKGELLGKVGNYSQNGGFPENKKSGQTASVSHGIRV